VLEGLAVALANVDEMIELIKAAPTPPVAKDSLMSRSWNSPVVKEMLARAASDASRPDGLAEAYGLKDDGYYLSDVQAGEILQMRLQRLTGLEQDKIVGEYKEVMDQIADLIDILSKPERITSIIAEELAKVKDEFGDARRSVIEMNASTSKT